MANFCLPTSAVNKFTQALKDGTIDPFKLNQLSSDERRAVFEKIVGKTGAKQVNAEFETKMLLKNQKYAYTSWAKKVAGITPQARRDLVSRIAKLDKALSPDDEKAFLKDLASTKLGVNVTHEEAKQIADLSRKVTAAEAAPRSTIEQASKKGWEPAANDLAYGRARYDLEHFVGDLKGNPKQFHFADLKTHPIKTIEKLPRAVADVTKSIGASLDDSFALRQGFKAFWTDFPRWQKEFRGSFVNLVKGFKDAQGAERELSARLMADPHYDQAVKDGLAIRDVKSIDDVFPTSLPGRIPVAGRFFNASEVAYSAFADNLRMGIYKNQIKLADRLGEGLAPDVRKNIAKEVNALTGRGSFGAAEPVARHLNIAFYSARFLKSNIDTLFLHPAGIGVGGLGSAAQKTAAKNLLKIIAGTAIMLKTADSIKPGSVEWDPRSTNFGQIKVGSTTFDVSGGMRGIVTLAARLATQSTKSQAGNVSKINSGKFGSETGTEVLGNFLEGKTSPLGGVFSDILLRGTNMNTNQKPTVKSEVGNLVPLNIQNYEQLKGTKNSANILVSVLADTLGISTNTISTANKNQQALPKASAEVQATLQKAQYSFPSLNQSERNVNLSKPQYSEFQQKTTSNFIQAVQKARNDPTFQSYSPAQQKASLSSSLTKAKNQALDSMGIKKPPKAKHVKTF